MEDIRIQYPEGEGYAIITLDREQTRNAMSEATLDELIEALDLCSQNRGIRCAILTGAGERAFSSGGDLAGELYYVDHPVELERFNAKGAAFLKQITDCRLPVITAVNGAAFGAALGIMCVSDFTLSVDTAVFGFPTSSLGGIPGWGVTHYIPRAIGLHNAKWLLMGNNRVDAGEALRMGLVDRVVPRGELMPSAIELAKRIASYPPDTIALLKRVMNAGMDGSVDEAVKLEAVAFRYNNVQDNFREGIASFLDKRSPSFRYD